MTLLRAAWLGRIAYEPAFELQQVLAAKRALDEVPDSLLLLEHDHVYTLGRRATDAEVLLDDDALRARGVDVVHSDRGGLATYHGPGQLVGYPIVSLGPAPDMPAYVASLERALIATLADFGIGATTLAGHRGVWVENDKIGAIGVHVSRGVTTHGFALNVSCDLSMFGGIVPCGILDKGVASIASLTGTAPDLADVAARAASHVATELRRALEWEPAHV
ncbi:MAG: lipoyl(octanoyl) transferase LipB [Actinomycetota bacterium]